MTICEVYLPMGFLYEELKIIISFVLFFIYIYKRII